MKRFIYAPDVNAYIATSYGILDVSPDIINGSVTRRRDAASQATLVLQNPYRKYLRKMKAMDRIVIYLTRVKPMLVFSGYLDSVPVDQLYPEPVTIKATCTLKRLLHTYWDPQLPYVTKFFADHGWTFDPLTGNIYDLTGKSLWNLDINTSIGHMLRVVMNSVGNWPIGLPNERANTVHILKLPQKFIDNTNALIAKEVGAQEQQRKDIAIFLKQLLTVQGVFSAPFGGSSDYNPSDSLADSDPLPASLAGKYTAKIYGPSNVNAVGGSISAIAIDDYLRSKGSPMAGLGGDYVAAGKASGVDPRLMVAISGAETSFGTRGQGPSVHNAWGMFDSHSQNISYATWKDGIVAATQNIAGPLYRGRGANTILKIWAIWAPSGATNDPTGLNTFWPVNVKKFYTEQGGIADGDITWNPDAPAASAPTADVTGTVGDVKVGNLAFFKTDPHHRDTIGYTFRVKGNPYNNDTFIFRAVSHDPSLKSNEIAIWLPLSSPQGQNWKDGPVSVETSINQASRFAAPTGTGVAASQIDISKMTQSQLTGGGVSTNGLQPIALAGLAFIQTNFGPFQLTSGLRPGDGGDHGKGLALDLVAISANGAAWPTEGIVRADALAKWAGFVQSAPAHSDSVQVNTQGNPATRWVGWRYVGGHGPPTGSGAYPNGFSSEGSGPHLHISFSASSSVDQIPSADGNITKDSGVVSSTLGGTGVQINQQKLTDLIGSIGIGLPLVFPLVESATEAVLFKGERALYNDQALMEFVQFMCKSSGRSFQSMPNGDFMAFYPDYFNWSGETPYFKISDIETEGDLTIYMSDDQLATHVFTTADSFSVNGSIDITDKLASTVASIESVAAFKELVNVGPEFNAPDFLKRYGARPLIKEVPEVKNSFMQFMYGWMTFLEQWAKIFVANPTFTFMPELIPGGLIEFESKDLVMFVDSVTHNFDRSSGFTTSAELIAPSTSAKQTNFWSVISNPKA